MLSFLELALLIAAFLTLRALSRWLKSYVAHSQSKDMRMKALGLFAAVLPFPAPGKTGIARYVFWVPTQLLVLIVLYVTYCMARIAYWDHEVRQMCAKDGGVQIYERIEISRDKLDSIPRFAGFLSVPNRANTNWPDAPAYSDRRRDLLIHPLNPRVYRTEYGIYRKTDEKLIAKDVVYSRVGGDFIGPWEGSSYGCPDPTDLGGTTQNIYRIK